MSSSSIAVVKRMGRGAKAEKDEDKEAEGATDDGWHPEEGLVA